MRFKRATQNPYKYITLIFVAMQGKKIIKNGYENNIFFAAHHNDVRFIQVTTRQHWALSPQVVISQTQSNSFYI